MQDDDSARGRSETPRQQPYERPRIRVMTSEEVLSRLGPARAVVYGYDPGDDGLG